jgi:cytochrome c peroxidase
VSGGGRGGGRDLDCEVTDNDPALSIDSSCGQLWRISKASCATTHGTEETTERLLEMIGMVTKDWNQALRQSSEGWVGEGVSLGCI